MTYSEKHSGISAALASGGSVRDVAKRFGVSKSMVGKHRTGETGRSDVSTYDFVNGSVNVNPSPEEEMPLTLFDMPTIGDIWAFWSKFGGEIEMNANC